MPEYGPATATEPPGTRCLGSARRRDVQPLVAADEIGEPGGEAEERDRVLGFDVTANDVGDRQAGKLRDGLEVAAVVADGNLVVAALVARLGGRDSAPRERDEVLPRRLDVPCDEHRPVARHDVDEPGELRRDQPGDSRRRAVGKIEHQTSIADGPKLDRGHAKRANAIPAASSSPATRRATSSAPGVSPCRQIERTASSIRLPSTVTTAPSTAISTA